MRPDQLRKAEPKPRGARGGRAGLQGGRDQLASPALSQAAAGALIGSRRMADGPPRRPPPQTAAFQPRPLSKLPLSADWAEDEAAPRRAVHLRHARILGRRAGRWADLELV